MAVNEWKPGTVVAHKAGADGWTRIVLLADGQNRSFTSQNLVQGATEESTREGAAILMRDDDAVKCPRKS